MTRRRRRRRLVIVVFQDGQTRTGRRETVFLLEPATNLPLGLIPNCKNDPRIHLE